MTSAKEFDTSRYSELISYLNEQTPTKEFEEACNQVAIDLLHEHEGFSNLRKGPDYGGTPFDFFGFKDGKPYIIEFKSSLKAFNSPGEVQKRRLQEVLEQVDGLNVALLQLKLKQGEYRILYNDELDRLFEGRRLPIAPIVEWVRKNMTKDDSA